MTDLQTQMKLAVAKAAVDQIKDGMMWPNSKPGLGIDINEKIAKKFPFKEREYGGAWDTVRRSDGSMVKP